MASTIRRKPVPSGHTLVLDVGKSPTLQPATSPQRDPKAILDDGKGLVDSPMEEGEDRPELDKQLEDLQIEWDEVEDPSAFISEAMIEEPLPIDIDQMPLPLAETPPIDIDQTSSPKSSKLKTAFEEVRHYAGGLISHPFEATKHFTVLRHSHGLVYYQGPSTSIAITVFSDHPLPADRKLWLQKRGFSGNTGMKIKTLGSRSAWIDVTPAVDITADSLPESDKRAWQRDIDKFLKKAKTVKHVCNHRPYETDVVRVPHQAEDGYFRIVLCADRKVLCPSPVFRYASSSTDPSILRGASLTSLPMELGIKISSFVARNAANTAASGALQPVTNAIQNLTKPYQLGGLTQFAARAAYSASGAEKKVDTTVDVVDEIYDKNRDLDFTEATESIGVIGSEDGPSEPFPIRFSGKVVQGSGKNRIRYGVPTANLAGVPEDTTLRLSGTYAAWASIAKTKASDALDLSEDVLEQWLPAVVMVSPDQDKPATVTQQRSVWVSILNDFQGSTLLSVKVNVMLMALLHSLTTSMIPEVLQAQMLTDIATTATSLSRPAWMPEMTLERIKTASSGRSFTERLANVRSAGQKQIDRVPIHRLGVRMNSMGARDELIGNGGLCIRR